MLSSSNISYCDLPQLEQLLTVSPTTTIEAVLEKLRANSTLHIAIAKRQRPATGQDLQELEGIIGAGDILKYLGTTGAASPPSLRDPIEWTLTLDGDDESYLVWERSIQDDIKEALGAFTKGLHRAVLLQGSRRLLLTQMDIVDFLQKKYPAYFEKSVREWFPWKKWDGSAKVATIDASSTLKQACVQLKHGKYPCFAVLDGSTLVGSFSPDLALKLDHDKLDKQLQTLLRDFVGEPDTPMKQVVTIMRNQRDSRVYCLQDGPGSQLLGVVSASDVLASVVGMEGKMARQQTVRPHNPYRPFKEPYTGHCPLARFDMANPTVRQTILSTVGPDEMLTALGGHWMIYQLERGHRITTDDCIISALVVHHYKSRPSGSGRSVPGRYLDLGTGLASVLHLVSLGLDLKAAGAVVLGLEAQERHVELARRTTHFNGLDAAILHTDLRDVYQDATAYPEALKFDLVTGTPPYFPPANGSLPHLKNRAECAFEFRGDVGVYLGVASQVLKSDGVVFIANGGTVDRTVRAGIEHGFSCIRRWEICGRIGKETLFNVYMFLVADKPATDPVVDRVYIRDAMGQFTKQYEGLVALVGKPSARFEPASVPKNQLVGFSDAAGPGNHSSGLGQLYH
ncbi:hypothetical protein HDU91_003049 [Kappamyces sp. JEL0680]|nr:hypothetical protein HDU91_003049 [Kappamyces sp. JEL0680]